MAVLTNHFNIPEQAEEQLV